MSSPTATHERIFEFAVQLATCARLFTLHQVARHPDISWRTQPVKRASEFLRPYAESFECLPGPHGSPFRWRLSSKERRRRRIYTPKVDPMSQKAAHWLGLGDVWLALTFHGGRPTKWIVEPDHQFDVYFEWQHTPFLLEYQRTRLSERQWRAKWEKRLEWYRCQSWHCPPQVILLTTTHQTGDVMHIPRGTIHVTNATQLPQKLSLHLRRKDVPQHIT